MSGRTVPRFALAGLLAATLAAPGVAQERRVEAPLNSPLFQFRYTLPAAPMPRPKVHIGEIEVDLSFGPPVMPQETRTGQFIFSGGINSDAGLTGTIAADRPCCGADCCRKLAAPVTPPLPTPSYGYYRQYNYANGVVAPQPAQILVPQQLPPVPPRFVMAPPAPPYPTPGTMTGGPGCCRSAPAAISAVPAMPACGPVTQLQQFTFGNAYPLQLVVASETACPQTASNPLLGTWYRDMGVGVTAVTFTPDEMKLCLASREGGNAITITITAHYTMTKDGLVYGAVTGADVDAKLDSKTEAGAELTELSLMLQELTDRPFSFRAKATSAGLMVSQLKVGSGEQIRSQELAVLGGLYKFAKDGRVPAPAAPKPTGTVPQLVPSAPPIGAATGEPLQRIGVDFNIVAPPCPVGRCEAVAAPSPVCNDATKMMAVDAFNQMMRPAGGMTLPSSWYLNHQPQYIAPDPAFPLPRELACEQLQSLQLAAPAKPGPLGTWYREIGSKRCVVKVEPDHLTITVSEAHDFDGQTVTGHLTITADYHTTRDGLTAVGLITSVDAKFDGDLPDDDAETMPEKIAELQKALEEKPFAITFRRYGEALVIGNVRMPDVGDRMEFQPATYLGGRFKTVGDKPLPKLKAVKEGEPKPAPVYLPPPPPGMYGPPGRPGGYGYGPLPGVIAVPPQPGIYPPSAAAPQCDLLPPQAMPYPAPPVAPAVARPGLTPQGELPSNWTGPGVLRRSYARLDGTDKPTYALETAPGVVKVYVIAGRDIDLEKMLGKRVDVYGVPRSRDGLSKPYVVATAVQSDAEAAGEQEQAVPYSAPSRPAGLVLPAPTALPAEETPSVPMTAPTPPVMPMPAPIPPADSSDETPSAKATEKVVEPAAKPAKKQKKMKSSNDAIARVQKVIDQSEELKRARDEAALRNEGHRILINFEGGVFGSQ